MTAPPPIELRAQSWWHVPVFLIGSLLFVAVGCGLIVTGATELPGGIVFIVAGLLAIGFFGGLLVTGLPDLIRGRSLRLDGRGILIRRGGEQLELRWSEIVAVGVVAINRNKLVGLLLADPGSAARRAPAAATGGNPTARRILAVAGSALRWIMPGSVPGDPGSVAPAEGTLRYNRANFGYDVLLGWLDRDRSAPELLELIGRYRR